MTNRTPPLRGVEWPTHKSKRRKTTQTETTVDPRPDWRDIARQLDRQSKDTRMWKLPRSTDQAIVTGGGDGEVTA